MVRRRVRVGIGRHGFRSRGGRTLEAVLRERQSLDAEWYGNKAEAIGSARLTQKGFSGLTRGEPAPSPRRPKPMIETAGAMPLPAPPAPAPSAGPWCSWG